LTSQDLYQFPLSLLVAEFGARLGGRKEQFDQRMANLVGGNNSLTEVAEA
jgi:hypothetical protein